jgi:HAD superfamily hydrolase (TIGR01548 family)
MAGLRVGYLLGAPGAIATLAGFGSPYPVSGVSVSLAERALDSDGSAMGRFVAMVLEQRERLAETLVELGVAPLPSQANFVLARVPDPELVVRGCASLGVGIRGFADRPELDGWVRVSLPGDPTAFDRLVGTLRVVLAPEALLFDLDGVLADVAASYNGAIVATAAEFGVEAAMADIVAEYAAGGANDDREITRRICARAGVDVPIDRITERFQAIYHGSEDRPGLKETERLLIDPGALDRLAARLPLGIVTGRPRAEAEDFLDRFGIADRFGVVVTGDDGPLKPDPAPVRLAVERLGVDRAWMVGDTPDDLAAAAGAGVMPLGVAPPGAARDRHREILAGAARVLDQTGQIEEVLDATGR